MIQADSKCEPYFAPNQLQRAIGGGKESRSALRERRAAQACRPGPSTPKTPVRGGCPHSRLTDRGVYAAHRCDAVAGHASGPSVVSGTIMLAPNWASTSAWLLLQPSYT